ncbi:hypothetical protein SB783_28040 [Paraburkholderia sp. SIMBA_009]|uniref:hypothetical protein n=1 Tax=Paraburkholderia tropica TaxID=92647 RepID=UPI000F559905|nr:hypothetical protein [Paraburkholderia tropica]RQN36230.1 hypothetical protein EHZ25_24750 [Paraburkholderia tropica]
MDDEKKWNPGALAGRLAQQMIELELTWSEAVAILGLAAKTIAQAAASAGRGDTNRFVEKGRRQLLGAFDCEVRVTVKDRAPARNDEDPGNPSLATARRRGGNSKLH